MKIKIIIIILLTLGMIFSIHSQNTSIEFSSSENTSVIIYRPMDDNYNKYCPTDTIVFAPGQKVNRNFDITNWAVVKCIIPKKDIFHIYIEKGDSIRLKLVQSKLVFEGNNVAGHQFSYQYNILKEYHCKQYINTLFQSKDSVLINRIIDNPRLLVQDTRYYEQLDSIYQAKLITEKCYLYNRNELDYLIRSKLLEKYVDSISRGIQPKDRLHSKIERIVQNVSKDENVSSYISGSYYIYTYNSYLYRQLDEKSKVALLQNKSKDTFGPYQQCLVCHGRSQLSVLFAAFNIQFQYGYNEFDRKKMYQYLTTTFPGSQSVEVLKRQMANELQDTLPVNAVFLDGSTIRTFSDITKNEKLKNKIIFIDVWASWCMPCRAEFSHNKKLESLLGQYPNIEKLYITIDKDTQSWKNAIQTLKLSGYHLLASKELLERLKKEVYESNAITVPKYILVDYQGNILSGNLPRPSDIEGLKVTLNQLIK